MTQQARMTWAQVPMRICIELLKQDALCSFVARLVERQRHIRKTGIAWLMSEEL